MGGWSRSSYFQSNITEVGHDSQRLNVFMLVRISHNLLYSLIFSWFLFLKSYRWYHNICAIKSKLQTQAFNLHLWQYQFHISSSSLTKLQGWMTFPILPDFIHAVSQAGVVATSSLRQTATIAATHPSKSIMTIWPQICRHYKRPPQSTASTYIFQEMAANIKYHLHWPTAILPLCF